MRRRTADREVDRGGGPVVLPAVDNPVNYTDPVAPTDAEARPAPMARYQATIRKDGRVRVTNIRLAEALMGDPPSSHTEEAPAPTDEKALPLLLLPAEVAGLLRTTDKAIYAKVERGLLAGVVRDGTRILFDRDVLLRELRRGRGR
ncbi:MAG: hypothetical protein IT375_25805 [Polyangiaceae bacterium]|nr:hypothetical protein [Polyangiaceae bacterium]